MNEKCKYCNYVSKCSQFCEYNSVICKLHRSFPKIVSQSYEEVEQENKTLKKQLEKYENELEKADSITQSCIFKGKKESEISYRKCLNMLEKHNNQQKEFIEWLEAMSKMYENEYKDIDIAGHYNCVLTKYKEIIGE